MVETNLSSFNRQIGKAAQYANFAFVDGDHPGVKDDHPFVTVKQFPEIQTEFLFSCEYLFPVVYPSGGKKEGLCLRVVLPDFVGDDCLQTVTGLDPPASKNFNFRVAMSVSAQIWVPACGLI